MWLEVDALLTALAAQRPGPPLSAVASAQLLSLLPPPPAAGWPAPFRLAEQAEALRERTEEQAALAMFNPGVDEPVPFVPCDAARYPPRRRAQKLSCLVWPTICQDNDQLQAALEAGSTADRLRLALLRLRALNAAARTE